MNNIVFEHVVKAYGKNVIVNDLNMEIREGERLDGGVLGGGALLAASSSGVRLFSVLWHSADPPRLRSERASGDGPPEDRQRAGLA